MFEITKRPPPALARMWPQHLHSLVSGPHLTHTAWGTQGTLGAGPRPPPCSETANLFMWDWLCPPPTLPKEWGIQDFTYFHVRYIITHAGRTRDWPLPLPLFRNCRLFLWDWPSLPRPWRIQDITLSEIHAIIFILRHFRGRPCFPLWPKLQIVFCEIDIVFFLLFRN